MSKGSLALLLVAAAAIALTVALAARDTRSLAFTLGVIPQQVVVTVPPGHEACQAPIDVSAPFKAIELTLGTYRRPGPPLSVVVREARGSHVLSTGRLKSGYADNSTETVHVAGVAAGRRIAVCVRTRDRRQVALYGGPPLAARTSTALLDGKALPGDISLVFVRRHPARAIALLPEIFRRAALFRPTWVGAWIFWMLGAACILLVPLLLATALRLSEDP